MASHICIKPPSRPFLWDRGTRYVISQHSSDLFRKKGKKQQWCIYTNYSSILWNLYDANANDFCGCVVYARKRLGCCGHPVFPLIPAGITRRSGTSVKGTWLHSISNKVVGDKCLGPLLWCITLSLPCHGIYHCPASIPYYACVAENEMIHNRLGCVSTRKTSPS